MFGNMLYRIDRYLNAADELTGKIGPYVIIAVVVAIALVYGDDIISAFSQH